MVERLKFKREMQMNVCMTLKKVTDVRDDFEG